MEWKFFLLIFGLAAGTNSRNSDQYQRQLDFETTETQQWPQNTGTQSQGRTNQGAVSSNEYFNTQNTVAPIQGRPALGNGPADQNQNTPNTVVATQPRPPAQGNLPADQYHNTQNTGAPTQTQFQTNPHEKFNTKLFQLLGTGNVNQNVVYSPISLQTLLAFVLIGANGQTAHELQRGLELPDNKNEVAAIFGNLIASQKSSRHIQTIMANRLYYSRDLVPEQGINNVGKTSFDAELKETNFGAPLEAARDINAWVAEKTRNLIQNIIDPYTLDTRTAAILVNAIYFKAKWEKEFSTDDTQKYNFHTGPQRTVLVDMMYNDDAFRYGEFSDLQAKVIELPYNNTDMSMMIILPNEKNGLQAVERRLQYLELGQLSAKLKTEAVTVRIPKFKIEYQTDMAEPLKQLGIKRLFSGNAELQDFFGPNQPVGISKILHKAFIDVNEAGTEAAAASFAKFIPLSLPPKLNLFTADHPFMFAIRSPRAVYFVGHVVNFNN